MLWAIFFCWLARATALAPERLWSTREGAAYMDAGSELGFSPRSGYLFAAGHLLKARENKDELVIRRIDQDTGEVQWLQKISKTGEDHAHGIAIDSEGNVFVAGKANGESFRDTLTMEQPDLFVVHLDEDGTLTWATLLQGNGTDVATSIVAHDSVVYGCGHTDSPSWDGLTGNGTDFVLFAFKSNMLEEKLWRIRFGGDGADKAMSIALQVSTASLFVLGESDSIHFDSLPFLGMTDMIVQRWSSDGVLQWSKRFGGDDQDSSKGIAVAPNGELIIVGESISTTWEGLSAAGGINHDIVLARLNSVDGTIVWKKRVGGSGSESACEVSLSPISGAIFVVGQTTSNDFFGHAGMPGHSDIVALKLTSGGDVVWGLRVTLSANDDSSEVPTGCVFSPNDGALYLAAHTDSVEFDGHEKVSEHDVVLLKYSVCPLTMYEDKSDGSCISCPLGSFCDGYNRTTCPDDFYCPGEDTPPIPCVAGVECNGTVWKECSLGQYCPAGTDVALACSPGHFCNATHDITCDGGVFCSEDGTSLTECPEGSFCPPLATSPSDCGSADVFCPRGSAVPAPVSKGYFSSPATAPSQRRINQTACQEGSFCMLGVQADCSAGFYCPAMAENETVCGSSSVYCPERSASPRPVPAGYYGCPIASLEDRRSAAEPCEPGFFCEDGNRFECPDGFFCPRQSLSAVDCGNFSVYCPAKSEFPQTAAPGFYTVGGPDEAHRTGVLPCLSTYVCVNGKKASCPAGYYCPAICGSPEPCGSGYKCAAGSSTPIAIKKGYYGTGCSNSNSSFCSSEAKCEQSYFCLEGLKKDCPPGYFCVGGTSVPSECGNVAYYCPQKSRGKSHVKPGYYSSGGTATTRSSQIKCEEGYYCVEGERFPCPKNHDCPSGSFKPISPDGEEADAGDKWWIWAIIIVCGGGVGIVVTKVALQRVDAALNKDTMPLMNFPQTSDEDQIELVFTKSTVERTAEDLDAVRKALFIGEALPKSVPSDLPLPREDECPGLVLLSRLVHVEEALGADSVLVRPLLYEGKLGDLPCWVKQYQSEHHALYERDLQSLAAYEQDASTAACSVLLAQDSCEREDDFSVLVVAKPVQLLSEMVANVSSRPLLQAQLVELMCEVHNGGFSLVGITPTAIANFGTVDDPDLKVWHCSGAVYLGSEWPRTKGEIDTPILYTPREAILFARMEASIAVDSWIAAALLWFVSAGQPWATSRVDAWTALVDRERDLWSLLPSSVVPFLREMELEEEEEEEEEGPAEAD